MDTSPASVLVIEPHPLMRDALCAAIAAEPELRLAIPDVSHIEALVISAIDEVLYLPCQPDIILLALGNPGMTELDALRSLRSAFPKIPILALTNNEVAGQEQAALNAGATAALTKAAPRTDLIRSLLLLQADRPAPVRQKEAKGFR